MNFVAHATGWRSELPLNVAMSLGISRHSMGFYKSKSLLRARTHGKTCYSDQGFDLAELNFGNHAITKDIGLLFQHRATPESTQRLTCGHGLIVVLIAPGLLESPWLKRIKPMACSKTERIQLQSTGNIWQHRALQSPNPWQSYFKEDPARTSSNYAGMRKDDTICINLLWLWAFAMIQSTSVCSTSEPWRNWHGSLMISNMINMFQLCVQMCSVCFSLHRMVPILVLFWLHDDFQSWSHDGQVLIPLWSRLWLHDRPNCDSMISADTLQLIPK